MSIELLDTVVLETDLPGHGLERGDIGAVVEVYSSEAVDVEFVTAAGQTQALVTLSNTQIRPVGPYDIPSVRSLTAV